MGAIETSLEGGIFTITLNNPPRNVLSRAVLEEFARLEGVLFSDEVQAVILTGAGRIFCAGADVDEMPEVKSREEMEAFSTRIHTFFQTFYSLPKPTIAAINGTCLGGGLELALLCHFRLCAERGMIGLPEIELGLIPGLGGTQRLPRLIGEAAALEMILTGSTLGPEDALKLGLVSRIVPRKELGEEALALARRLLGKDRTAMARAIRATRGAMHMPIAAGLELERTFFAELWAKTFKSPGPQDGSSGGSGKNTEE